MALRNRQVFTTSCSTDDTDYSDSEGYPSLPDKENVNPATNTGARSKRTNIQKPARFSEDFTPSLSKEELYHSESEFCM